MSIRLGYRLFGTLETTYTAEVEVEDSPLADKSFQAVAFPLLVHRIELGVGYQF